MASAAVPTIRRIPPPRIYGRSSYSLPMIICTRKGCSFKQQCIDDDRRPKRNNRRSSKRIMITRSDRCRSIEKGDSFLSLRCLIEESELREVNRRQLIRIEFLERDYRQLDDDLLQIQNERDLLLKQKRM